MNFTNLCRSTGLLLLICTLEASCRDRDCNEWYTFEVPPEIHNGVVSDVGDVTFLYGGGGLMLVSKTTRFWPPNRWAKVETHTIEDILDVHANGPTMILVGTAGAVRYSTDDAETWQTPEVPNVNDTLNAVDADCSTGTGAVAVGEGGIILYTNDISHWWLGSSPVDATLRDVVFVDPEVIAVGDDGTMLVSEDGGVNWSLVPLGIEDDILAINFPPCGQGGVRAYGRGVMMTSSGAFYVSRDSGRTWKRQYPDAPGKPTSMLVFDPIFPALRVEVAIGSELWALNPRELSEVEQAKGWTLQQDFQEPIKTVFNWTAVLTQGASHYYRDGYRCSLD